MSIKLKLPSVHALVILLLWLQELFACAMGSEKVYFDKYGHCERTEAFDLSADDYKAVPEGGGFNHETLDCTLTFKAAPGYGVCIKFDDFYIRDCVVNFMIYESRDETGEVWKQFSCSSDEPSQMCTSERYVTLRLLKSRLNSNRGYKFKIKIEQSTRITDEGVVFASIGLVVGIICAVIVLLIIIALLVFCCCRKKQPTHTKNSNEDDQVQPSAPPLLDQEEYPKPVGLYPHLQNSPMIDPPPPYEQPPSYTPVSQHQY